MRAERQRGAADEKANMLPGGQGVEGGREAGCEKAAGRWCRRGSGPHSGVARKGTPGGGGVNIWSMHKHSKVQHAYTTWNRIPHAPAEAPLVGSIWGMLDFRRPRLQQHCDPRSCSARETADGFFSQAWPPVFRCTYSVAKIMVAGSYMPGWLRSRGRGCSRSPPWRSRFSRPRGARGARGGCGTRGVRCASRATSDLRGHRCASRVAGAASFPRS